MYIATFAHKGFTVSSEKVITFSDLQFSSSLDTEKQDNSGDKPSTYIKNQGLATFSIKIKVDSSLGVIPSSQIDDWMKLLAAKAPHPFLLKGTPLLNTKWLLVDVSVSATAIDGKGNILAAEISLKFDEFASQGSKKDSSSSASGKSKKAKDTSSVYDALKPAQKSSLKTASINFRKLERLEKMT